MAENTAKSTDIAVASNERVVFFHGGYIFDPKLKYSERSISDRMQLY